MIVKNILEALDDFASFSTAEKFDNTGLLVGDSQRTVKGIMVCHDALECIIDEAIEQKCNLIVSFHPILFKGIKKINNNDYVGRSLTKAIENKIAIIAVHTAWDKSPHGVNSILCDSLGIQNKKILLPESDIISQLTTYIPKNKFHQVKQTLFDSGAGEIGDYSHCSFNTQGEGSFKGNTSSNPIIGKAGELTTTPEVMLSVIFESYKTNRILKTLREAHPYEEIAYELKQLKNKHQNIGMGMIGELESSIKEMDFLTQIKTKLNIPCIKHSKLLGGNIKRVAVLGGSGSFAIEAAITQKADIFLTGDLKYHDFFKAEKNIILADIGHYESEKFTKNIIHEYLTKKFANFAVILAKTETNPVNYF